MLISRNINFVNERAADSNWFVIIVTERLIVIT